MKTMVKLAVLITILLLLAGVAFAEGPCYYYEYTYTGLDVTTDSGGGCVELCFDYGNNTGEYSRFCLEGDLVLFSDSMNKQALLYYPQDDTIEGEEYGYLKFHGDWFSAFTGIIYCNVSFPNRYFVRGHKVETCDNGV